MHHNFESLEAVFDNITSTYANVSRETLVILSAYVEDLLKWNNKFNLVSKRYNNNAEQLWVEQILPCVNLYDFIDKNNYSGFKIIDFGSGAGLPGLIICILGLKNIITIDRRQKKINFQKHFVNKFNLQNQITPVFSDIANLEPVDQPVLIVSKAVASCDDVIQSTQHLLDSQSEILLLKKHSQLNEIANINKDLFDTCVHNNSFNNEDCIFQIITKTHL